MILKIGADFQMNKEVWTKQWWV